MAESSDSTSGSVASFAEGQNWKPQDSSGSVSPREDRDRDNGVVTCMQSLSDCTGSHANVQAVSLTSECDSTASTISTCAESERDDCLSQKSHMAPRISGNNPDSSASHQWIEYGCKKHGALVSRYCYDCGAVLCAECAKLLHGEHACEGLKLVADRCREAVQGRLAQMRTMRSLASGGTEAVERRKADVVRQTETATSEIRQQFDAMISALQERREELLDCLAELSVGKLRSLCEQEQALSHFLGGVEGLISKVECALAASRDEEIVGEQQHLEILVAHEVAGYEQIPLVPVEVPDIVVEVCCLEDVKKTCKAGTKVYRSNFSGEGAVGAAMEREASFSLRSSSPTPQPASIKAVLTSVVEPSIVVPMKVTCHKGSPLYQVTYTPKVRGRNMIFAEENGQTIAGSPLEVFVSIQVNQMGAVERQVGGLQCPTSLDFNSKNMAFISQRDSDYIAVRSRLGKRVQDLKNTKSRSCWGIAIDSKDDIYVTSPHHVTKFGSDGRLIKMVGEKGSRPGEFDNPRGIHIIGKKLYVCDRDNSRIQVFFLNLHLLEVISDKAMKWVTDVAGSPDGRLFVIGQGVSSIQVFAPDHTYSSSIYHQDLSSLAGICFSTVHNLLFIVDCNSSGTCVFAFRCDGLCASKMTIQGSSGISYGIASDRDGFVYVCDGLKNLIHVL